MGCKPCSAPYRNPRRTCGRRQGAAPIGTLGSAVLKKAHRKGGRPRLDVLRRRSIRLLLHVNPEEGSALRVAAQRARQPLAQYIREAALGRPVVVIPEINRKAFSSLARIGVNLNQLAHHLKGGIPNPFPGPLPNLDELRNLLLTFRHGLLGLIRHRKPPCDPEDPTQDQ